MDEQDYEVETTPSYFGGSVTWVGLEGNVPRYQPWLRLRVRRKEGEKYVTHGYPGQPGTMGAVVAEMQIRNPLYVVPATEAPVVDPLPVKKRVGGHEIALVSARRSRVVGSTTLGMHFELHCDGKPDILEHFQLKDWTMEDGVGNVVSPRGGSGSSRGQDWDRALWSSPAVWKLRLCPVPVRKKDHAWVETFAVTIAPVFGAAPGEYTLKSGHLIRLDRVERNDTDMTFLLTAAPPLNGHSLVLLHASDEHGQQSYANAAVAGGQMPYADSMNLRALDGTHSTFVGRCSVPAGVSQLEVTFGFEPVEPVEFVFKPDLEP